jgi:hypothetical protein
MPLKDPWERSFITNDFSSLGIRDACWEPTTRSKRPRNRLFWKRGGSHSERESYAHFFVDILKFPLSEYFVFDCRRICRQFFQRGGDHFQGTISAALRVLLSIGYSGGRYRLTTSKFLNNVTDSPDDPERAVFDLAMYKPNCRLPSGSDSPS